MESILIADDEAVIQRTLGRAMSKNYRVLSALDGVETVKVAREEKPDLILLDIHMPKKNGTEALKELREDEATRMIPVIMLTADGAQADKIAGLESGADDYLPKPFDIEELRARVKSLLRRNKRALSANPLTLLPGNSTIEEQVNRRIREKAPFAFLYADIDHFKSFNDAYGYARGDRALRAAAAIFQEALDGAGGKDDFLGHVGGDDFVMITGPESAERVAAEAARLFDERAPSFYSGEDQDNGYTVSKNRMGHAQASPLMTVSIAIVTTERRLLDHFAKVVDLASEIKRHLKARRRPSGSAYLRDRRCDS